MFLSFEIMWLPWVSGVLAGASKPSPVNANCKLFLHIANFPCSGKHCKSFYREETEKKPVNARYDNIGHIESDDV